MTELLDIENAKAKINLVFSYWKNGDSKEFSKSNIFCVLSGKSSKDENATIQEQFQMWLLGYQLTETFFLFLKNEKLIILTSDKKKKFLQPLLENIDVVEVLERNNDNIDNFEKIKKTIEDSKSEDIAILKDTDATGIFFECCYDFIKKLNKFELDVSNNIKHLLNFRSDSDMKIQKNGSDIACIILKSILITTIENALDSEEFESHEMIKDKALKFHENKKCIIKLRDKLKVDIDDIDVIYSNVQSGNKFILNYKNSNDKNYLSQNEGTILVGIGIKYKELCCNITRTLLLNAKSQHKELYNFTVAIEKYIIKECLIVSMSYSDVYKKAVNYLKSNKREYSSLCDIDLEDYFVKCIGHVIGLEFMEKEFLITENNVNTVIEKNTSYNLSVGFENVHGYDKNNFAIWISDTIFINDKGEVTILTDAISKEINTISYELEDSKSDDEDKTDVKKEIKNEDKKKTGISASILNNAASVIVSDRLRRRNKNSLAHNNEQEMEELNRRQNELKEKKMNEIKFRFSKGTSDYKDLSKKNIKKLEDLKTYNDADLLPRDLKPNLICVDNKHECILLPINGAHIPFHVSTIKNLSSNYEDNNDIFVLRINFQVPGNQSVVKGDFNAFPTLQQKEMYIKELIFKSNDEKHLQIIVKQVKELIKQVKQKEVEADVNDPKHAQDKLILNKSGRRIILRDLMTRPNIFTGRKILGTLELHSNGLRYSANSRGNTEHIDILFDDIKYAFYQPCDGQLIILIHFHLKRYIMVGKKKTLDVQFYCEAGTQIDDLDRAKARNVYDPDEMHDEMKEREQKNKLNLIFKNFVQQMQDISKIEFEIPYPELTFSGVPNKSNVEIFVTANTINHLVEWPPFILSVEDIEIASLERVHHGLRNFDMIFVFKDYTKPVKRIDVIPTEYIDTIKKWLTTIDIVYYEGKNNLQWGNILKTILADIDSFVNSKGFDGFLGEDDEEDEHSAEDEDEDDEYEVDESELSAEDDSDYDDSEEESLATESDGEGEVEEDSEDEGLSWDELEERAKKDDKKRFAYKSDDDEEGYNKRKKKKN
ncbi:FACT complex subunit SPT16 [Plasmodium brasilianum]|uniref:FACT complex subunit n=2 Tax=Plasmodium (Plasmodium) TaxID=418103 RepID=A0A1D3RI31_PLAMA|nr:FACT complex subunit SPT16, putative [Plasmodium malariae]KAI4837804.1 FACT complex subunit SPT16 [Plasmodium brasilianum]SCN44842.1 FACT complex subunit SPT16, putative [Plasmodium malariae]